MAGQPIDVWDAKTLDPELPAQLHDQLDVTTDYIDSDWETFLAHELGRLRN